MQIQELGEFGVIDLLNRMVVQRRLVQDDHMEFGFNLLVDTGDDTAAWQAGVATELITTDTMVEAVHFTRMTTPWRDLGWKCIASNVSDIAAMGGLPMYALITLGLPPDTEVEDLEELYLGMLEISNKYGVAIVGGDMVRSPVVFITVSLTGVHSGSPMLRSNARTGDQVAVTGYLGGSGGGLRLMQEERQREDGRRGLIGAPVQEISDEAVDYLLKRHRRPEPAVAEGLILSGAGVLAAMDVSDGLADDASKLCRSSGVSVRLYRDRIPVHPNLKETFPKDHADLALHGGEDYLLLFTAPPDLMSRVMLQLPQGAGVVGELFQGEPGQVSVVDEYGAETTAVSSGWDHFR